MTQGCTIVSGLHHPVSSLNHGSHSNLLLFLNISMVLQWKMWTFFFFPEHASRSLSHHQPAIVDSTGMDRQASKRCCQRSSLEQEAVQGEVWQGKKSHLHHDFRERVSLLSISLLSKLWEKAIPFLKAVGLQLQMTPLSLPGNPRRDLAPLQKYLHQSHLIKSHNRLELWVSFSSCLTCIPVMSWAMIQNEKLDFSVWKLILLMLLNSS